MRRLEDHEDNSMEKMQVDSITGNFSGSHTRGVSPAVQEADRTVFE